MSKFWLIWLYFLMPADWITTGCKAQLPPQKQFISTPLGKTAQVNSVPTKESDATSFENAAVGPFDNLVTTLGTWTPTAGKTVIDDKHAKSGTKCLQLTGGEETTVVLKLKKKMGVDHRLTFWAER